MLPILAACAEQVRPAIDPGWLHWPRHGHLVVAVDDHLLLLGGHASGTRRSEETRREAFRLNPRTGERSPRAPMHAGRTFFAAVVVDGRVLAISSTIETYALDDDQWSVVLRDPRLPRSHVSATAVGRSVFIFGGFPEERPGFLRVDVDSATLHELPPPPDFVPGDHLARLAGIDGRLHLFGGLGGVDAQPSTRHWIWDGAEWTAGTPAPMPIDGEFGAFGAIDDELFFFGTGGAHAWSPSRDRWRECANIPEFRVMAASVVLDGRLHVIGGYGADAVLVYDPTLDAWERFEPRGGP